jgi:carboxylesterase type B
LPAEQLIDDSGADFLFQPVIDGTELPVHPVELVRRYGNGRLATDIDLMVGFCTDEGYVTARAVAQRRQQTRDEMANETTESRRRQASSCRTVAREIIEKDILPGLHNSLVYFLIRISLAVALIRRC